MIASNGESEQKHEPVASEEAQSAERSLHYEFRKNEVINPRRRIKWVYIVSFQVR